MAARTRGSRTRLGPLIVTALCIGALISLAGSGGRAHHFLPTFIIVSGFVLGVALLVNHVATRLVARLRTAVGRG
jgi:hypothetical protein